jgi:hypothetical protein
MVPPKTKTPAFLSIAGAELRLKHTLTNFLNDYDPRIRPTVARLFITYCSEWAQNSGHFPSPSVGLSDLAVEVHRQFWRDYYQENRAKILERQRAGYRHRKEQRLRQSRHSTTDAAPPIT